MSLTRLVYFSKPFGFDESTLNGILSSARRNNRRDGITGALVCRADIYLQLIEGPEQLIDGLFKRILRDDRHVEVAQLILETTETRMFPEWAMKDDPARSWMWSQKQVANGTVTTASRDDILAVFARLAAEVDGP